MSVFGAVKLIDEAGAAYGVKHVQNKPRVSAMPYLYDIAEGNLTGHAPFVKIGFTPTMTTTDSDIWSAAGVYAFPTAAAQWKIAAGNAADKGAIIKGNAEGANQTILCDATGNETTLVDADVNFTSATGVAVGDCVLLSPKGDSSTAALTPEWGYITDITNAATGTLIIGGGFSSAGTCAAARAYSIVDKSAAVGGQVVKIDYLTAAYAQKTILVALNGDGTAVAFNGSGGAALTDTFRVNSFRLVATGTNNVPTGAIALQLQAAATNYSYITAGFTRARNAMYTVPDGKTLYITNINAGFGMTAKAAITDYCRMFLRVNREPATNFLTGNLFYPLTEIISFGATVPVEILGPIKIAAKTDIKVSGYSSTAGVAVVTYRGWLE